MEMDFEIEKQDERWSDAFREACHVEAERPAHFWSAQRANIRAEIGNKQRRFSLRFALASMTALFVVAGVMLAGSQPPSPTPVRTATAMSDQEILANIDETLTNPIPDALAPADLLAQDLDRSLKASGQKETR
jgi:hypothetical protein